MDRTNGNLILVSALKFAGMSGKNIFVSCLSHGAVDLPDDTVIITCRSMGESGCAICRAPTYFSTSTVCSFFGEGKKKKKSSLLMDLCYVLGGFFENVSCPPWSSSSTEGKSRRGLTLLQS